MAFLAHLLRGFLLFFMLGAVVSDQQPPAMPTSLDPPPGNILIVGFNASGNQLYRCEQVSADKSVYQFLEADSSLYSYKQENEYEQDVSGYHYFLPRPDAAGAKATWSSLQNATVDVPDSTVTGLSIKIQPNEDGDIPDLLLRATSHSGSGLLSQVSYIQRLHSQGGGVSLTTCSNPGEIIKKPYQAYYAFWNQVMDTPPAGSPKEILPPSGTSPVLSLYGQGFQIYQYNGTEWTLINATASLSSSPGQQSLGMHFFLQQKDALGGQPTWALFYPLSLVTAKPLAAAPFEPSSINWALLQATSHNGDPFGLGSVTYLQRLSTTGGLAPSTTEGAKVGQVHESPYSAIYWFYSNGQSG